MHDTERITLGTGTVNLTNSHPAALAAKVAMLDTLLKGRFILGVSPGGLASDWEIFGNLSGVDRRVKAQECIDHVVALWTGEAPYDLSGEHWTLSTAKTLMADLGQGVMVRPYQRPHPPIVVTAAEPSSKSVDNAARRGWEVISANFLLPQWVRTHWETYRNACEETGREADPQAWRVARTIFVADDEATAREYAFGSRQPLPLLLRPARDEAHPGRAGEPLQDRRRDARRRGDERLHGRPARHRRHPDQVVDGLLEFRDVIGDFGTLLYCGTDWVDPRSPGARWSSWPPRCCRR